MPTKYADSEWVTELSVWDFRFCKEIERILAAAYEELLHSFDII